MVNLGILKTQGFIVGAAWWEYCIILSTFVWAENFHNKIFFKLKKERRGRNKVLDQSYIFPAVWTYFLRFQIVEGYKNDTDDIWEPKRTKRVEGDTENVVKWN